MTNGSTDASERNEATERPGGASGSGRATGVWLGVVFAAGLAFGA